MATHRPTARIVLRPELRDALEKSVEDEADLSDLVNEAVARYVRERQRAKLDHEILAYDAMRPELKQQYLDRWVAIHHRELVDHDDDVSALYQRVRARYGRTPVLIRQVKEGPSNEIRIRTPSTGRVTT